jgi:proteic killer suppression protein
MVIVSFACRKTERLWLRHGDHGLPPQIERVALRKLTQVDRSRELLDLRLPPGNRLEALKGDRKGLQSIRVNDQWRICFRWHAGDAYEVEIVDYH